MRAFLHVEVSWEDEPGATQANVRRMLGAVAHYPWRSTSVEDASHAAACCVMAVQRSSEGHRSANRASADRPKAHLAADIQLHARSELERGLGIPAGDALLLDDDDLILSAYQRWGLACADRLLGDGAFALWDAAEQRLVCWRDAAGVRPLYYHHVPGRRIVISSDLQSIAAHPAIPPRLDLPYTKAFLERWMFQHPTRTLIEGVLKLPPAHVLTFDRGGLQLRPYWEPDSVAEKPASDDRESVEELRSLLRQAILDRLRCAGEGVGAHLSGGLDSSSIAASTAALLDGHRDALSAFSWAPPREVVPAIEGDERDERNLVDSVARFCRIRARYTCLQAADLVDFACRDVALRPRETLKFELATSRQAAAAGVRTIFSGWGGDETVAFNGRGYFAEMARRGRFTTVQRELKLRSRIQGGSLRGAWKHRVLTPLLPDRALPRPKESPPLPTALRPDFLQLLRTVESLELPDLRERPGVHRMQRTLLRAGHLHYRMEAWAAHGAALGLAYTFPLLDRRIVELALSLPGRMYFREGWKRWLYRTSMEGILPDDVRWNPWKFDSAAGRQLHALQPQVLTLSSERLLERRDNPLVDVDAILARGNSASDPSSSYVGGGTWLAFTHLQPA
jgi:asparagine synthase (glutamine-hydrolysing)